MNSHKIMPNPHQELAHYLRRIRSVSAVINTLTTDALRLLQNERADPVVKVQLDTVLAINHELSNMYSYCNQADSAARELKDIPNIVTSLA